MKLIIFALIALGFFLFGCINPQDLQNVIPSPTNSAHPTIIPTITASPSSNSYTVSESGAKQIIRNALYSTFGNDITVVFGRATLGTCGGQANQAWEVEMTLDLGFAQTPYTGCVDANSGAIIKLESNLGSTPSASPTPITVSTVSNGGFEQGLDGWNKYGWGSSSLSVIDKIDSVAPISGSNSYYISERYSDTWVARCQGIGTTTGKTYTVNAKVRVESGSLSFWLTTDIPGYGKGECTGGYDGTITSTNTQQYTATCTPQYSNTLTICVGSGSLANVGSGWFDNIEITQTG